MAYTIIGNAVVEWDENEPLIFTLSEEIGTKDDLRNKTYKFDLTVLRAGFEEEFLLNFKDFIVERRHRVTLKSIDVERSRIVPMFHNVICHSLFDRKISVIDENFLLALNTIIEEVPSQSINTLRQYFNINPHSHIFDKELRNDDFPIKRHKKSAYGNMVESILAKALTRSACVEILSRCDEAYEDGAIDIGLFSFINLAFAVYVRPDSYRRIRISDLVYDTDTDTHFLYIAPVKTGVDEPQKICHRINKHVGTLLLKQRQQVIEKFGHLVNNDDIGKLALFPSRRLITDNSSWFSEYANNYFGEYQDGGKFSNTYFLIVRGMLGKGKYALNATALRHTVGTQMAAAGCSAKTIQAVLKHAKDSVCVAYVDIAFQGLINELNDAMQPAFEAHLPVFQRFRSKVDSVSPNKAIYSEDLEKGRTELTGECGKQIRCQAAPFTCYECNKFIPCFDSDHNLNHNIIQGEIDLYMHAGTAYRHLVEKAKCIKYRILLVMAACDRHQQAVVEQKGWS